MIRSGFLLVALCAVTALVRGAGAGEAIAVAASCGTEVNAAAVWNPSPDALAAVRQKCGEMDSTHIERCFLNEMKSARSVA